LFQAPALIAVLYVCDGDKCVVYGLTHRQNFLTTSVRVRTFLNNAQRRAVSLRRLIFRSSLTDDLIDWNSGVSVRPYVHKKFFPISI